MSNRATPRSGFRQFLASVSPVTYAVALTGLCAAALFVLTDFVRASGEVEFRSRLAASATATASETIANPITNVAQDSAIAISLALLAAGLAFRAAGLRPGRLRPHTTARRAFSNPSAPSSASWRGAITRKSSRPRPPARPRPTFSPMSATTSAHRSTTSSALPI